MVQSTGSGGLRTLVASLGSVILVCFWLSAAALGHGAIVKETYTVAPGEGGYRFPDPTSLGGSFELIDHNGRTVTDRDFRGKWMLLFFGFVGCRESCPVALDRMTVALEQLGEEAQAVQPIFVDVSLEAPDPKGLAQFVSNFHPRLIGLAGTRKQNFHVTRIFKVRREYGHRGWSARETGPRLDHSTYFYLVDPAGKTRVYFYHALPPEEIAAILRRYLAADRN